ncbi:MAG: AtpZ/AtpI family protein [Desulfobulbaceae bacterium]|nr:AtpZ/AtpI family protein [Desulfobulbaceae bacterium]
MKTTSTPQKEPLPKIIDDKVKQRQKAQREKQQTIFFGFGTFGMVGWSVAIPTLLATLVGRWLDTLRPWPFSWTLTGLFTGLMAGIFIAAKWVKSKGRTE